MKKMNFEENYAQNRMILREQIPLEIPLCISFEASDICNFRCVMCHHGNPEYDVYKKKHQNMELSLFQKCVNELANWCKEAGQRIKLIKLYSLGEPLVNPNIVDMVRIIKAADICNQLEITSNSSLLTEKVAKGLVDHGLDIFRASIYSVDEKRNREITQSSIKPDYIRENVARMKAYRDEQGKNKPFISAKMIDSYSEENDVFLKEYETVADEAYIDKILDNSESGEIIERYYKENSKKALEDIDRTRISAKRKSCRYPFTHMTIKGDGSVVVCCSDWRNQTEIGDANTSTLREIWNSKALYNFRCMTILTKGENHELCKSCEIPLRGYPEDDIDGIDIKRFDYWK